MCFLIFCGVSKLSITVTRHLRRMMYRREGLLWLRVSKISLYGQPAPLLSGLRRGRNSMAEGCGGGRLLTPSWPGSRGIARGSASWQLPPSSPWASCPSLLDGAAHRQGALLPQFLSHSPVIYGHALGTHPGVHLINFLVFLNPFEMKAKINLHNLCPQLLRNITISKCNCAFLSPFRCTWFLSAH